MFSTIINTQQLNNIIDSPQLIIFDCRHSLADTSAGKRDYKTAHIPHAIYIHLDDDLSGPIISGVTGRHPLPDVNIMVNRFGQWGIDNDKQVVVYDDKKGAIASRLWWMLRFSGHEKVAVLDGGWQKWEQEGKLTESTINEPIARTFNLKLQSNWTLDADQIQEKEREMDWAIIDSRSPERYSGAIEPIDPIAGHIPGAISRPFDENWTQEGLMKSPEKLRQRFADLPQVEKCVFYCGSGVTACQNILAFAHAGMGIPRLYPGSWSDWITDSTRLGKKKILAISGSVGQYSSNHAILRTIAKMHQDDLIVEFSNGIDQLPHFNPDVKDKNIPSEVRNFRRRIEGADGVIISTPEYVFSLPGSLKNALEWTVAVTVFSGKPVAIIVAAASGEKAFESLDLVMTTIEAKMTVDTKLHIRGIKGKVDKNGIIADSKTIDQLKNLTKGLIKTIDQTTQKS